MEATYTGQDVEIARRVRSHHRRRIRRVRARCECQATLSTHISRRYSGAVIEAEARAVFPNTIVAKDLDKAVVRRVG